MNNSSPTGFTFNLDGYRKAVDKGNFDEALWIFSKLFEEQLIESLSQKDSEGLNLFHKILEESIVHTIEKWKKGEIKEPDNLFNFTLTLVRNGYNGLLYKRTKRKFPIRFKPIDEVDLNTFVYEVLEDDKEKIKHYTFYWEKALRIIDAKCLELMKKSRPDRLLYIYFAHDEKKKKIFKPRVESGRHLSVARLLQSLSPNSKSKFGLDLVFEEFEANKYNKDTDENTVHEWIRQMDKRCADELAIRFSKLIKNNPYHE